MFDIENTIKEAKQEYANKDFELLLKEGNIAFYKGCELSHIFIFDKEEKKAINYFTLFSFDELSSIDKTPNYLSKQLDINDRYFCGIQRKRISIENAQNCFINIQKGILNFDEECLTGRNLYLLPKAFVPCESNEKALLNSILKPNYWGDNYIIEFFDEKKELLTEILNIKNVSEKIYDYIRKTQRIKMDFSKIYERIGNIIFQFPITICKTGIYSEKNSNDIRLKLEYHPRQKAGKNIHIIITASFDDTITAADYYDSCDLKIDHIFHLGDDYNLTTTILDKDNNLFLHKSTVNFIKKISISSSLGITYSEPRLLKTETGHKEIDLVHRTSFGINIQRKDYTDYINQRVRNNEIIRKSSDLGVFKKNQRQEALTFVQNRIKTISPDFIAIYLWDPYLLPTDIVNTLYYENSGLLFHCITDYHNTKKALNVKNFNEYIQKVKEEFSILSNNQGVRLKLVARYGEHGWVFHDRFLIFVPRDSFTLPEVYSLGISVNQLGKSHHIIQKVPNPRVILDDFEKLWKELDNSDCCVIQMP